MFEFLLAALPLLALLTALLLGRYPGCEAIVRLSERLSEGPRRRRFRTAGRTRRSAHRVFIRAGLMLAMRRSQLPPPLAV